MKLTLAEALKKNQLESFIREQESAGVGPGNYEDFDKAVSRVIRGKQSDRTSRYPSGDGSSGK